MSQLLGLCKHLGYNFKNIDYLKLALTHRSKSKNHNERLEFLGDSILGCIIADKLYDIFPDSNEGDLSRYKISLVNGKHLAMLASNFNLGEYLELGISEIKSGGHKKARLLEDVLEAIIGAIYLDSDYAITSEIILPWFEDSINKLVKQGIPKDSKSSLQEFCHKYGYSLPVYVIDKIEGDDHDQTLYISCHIQCLGLSGSAVSFSRKKAEQEAAKSLLYKIAKLEEK